MACIRGNRRALPDLTLDRPIDRIKRTSGLIALWALNEGAGATATAYPDTALNGANTAISAYGVGLQNGVHGYSYDNSTSLTNIYTAGLNSAFNGQEFSIVITCRVSGAGVWTDGAVRSTFTILVDGSNSIQLTKDSGNNTIRFRYEANNVVDVVDYTISTTAPFVMGCTCTLTGDAFKAFVDGAQVGVTQTGLGTYAGAISSSFANIGASAVTPTQVWDGDLALAAVYNRALTDSEMAWLA